MGGAVAMASVIFLRAPLKKLLIDLCGTEDRASFWERYTWTLVFIAPVLFGTILGDRNSSAKAIDLPFLEGAFKSVLLGLFIALIAVGLQLARITRGRLNPPNTG